jgi:hypothetical protein
MSRRLYRETCHQTPTNQLLLFETEIRHLLKKGIYHASASKIMGVQTHYKLFLLQEAAMEFIIFIFKVNALKLPLS